MKTKIVMGLLAVSLLAACQSTNQTAAQRPNLEQRMMAQNGNAAIGQAPGSASMAPEDIPGEGPVDPARNPSLLPTPLLRANAAGGL
jgi:hypothetical protein